LKWLDSFKIAVIEQDLDIIISLVQNSPAYEKYSYEQKQEIQALLNVATKLIKNKQSEILHQMKNIQKTKEFVKQRDGEYSLDMSF